MGEKKIRGYTWHVLVPVPGLYQYTPVDLPDRAGTRTLHEGFAGVLIARNLLADPALSVSLSLSFLLGVFLMPCSFLSSMRFVCALSFLLNVM
jgi:hypothetical protein